MDHTNTCPKHLLCIEDDDGDYALIASILRTESEGPKSKLKLIRAPSLSAALEHLSQKTPEAIICDLNLPDSKGLHTVEQILKASEAPVVVLSGAADNEVAEQAVRRGAQDYLEKDSLTAQRLWRCIHFAIERALLKEEWRRLRSRMEEQRHSESISRFTGGIAHDINNALGIICGYTEALQETGERILPEATEEILKASDRMADLIKKLMQLGGQEEAPQLEIFDLSELISQTKGHLERSLPQTCRLQILPGSECPVQTCELHIHQILTNLTMNAADAIGSAEGDIRISCELTPRDVRMDVQDSGPGIPDDVVELMLEPYFTTKEGNHSGLGLAIVNGILHSHGGRLECKTSSQGTTFTCIFPRADPETSKQGTSVKDATPSASEAPSPALNAPRILLAEDEQILRRLMIAQLSHLGCKVVPAADGAEALNLFLKEPASYDLVISDVMMPNMDGPTFVGEALKTRPDTPYLFVTGYSAGRLKREEWYKEDTPLMTKPYSNDDLRDMVFSLLKS